MKVFESTLVLCAIQAIANCQQVLDYFPSNQQGSPSDFEMERYGDHSQEYYYDSYTPRKRPYYGSPKFTPEGNPIRKMHHTDLTANDE